MLRSIIIWSCIATILFALFQSFHKQVEPVSLDYSKFVEEVQSGKISKVVIEEELIEGIRTDGTSFKSIRPDLPDDGLMVDLLNHNVAVEGRKPRRPSLWTQLLVASFPILLFLAVLMFFLRQQGGGLGGKSGPLSFGRNRARLMEHDQIETTFADVAGIDEAKEDVCELVEFLRDPEKFQKLGGRIPRGVLLIGSPGTGKTLLAKAIAGEAEVPFFLISGSDFVEMFVGVGASRVRDMFEQAKRSAPCIVFIDEIDAVGRHRGAGLGGGHDEREQTLNQLLVEMDGFEASQGVIVIAATNRPDVLDPALLRPGRFDRQISVGLPDIRGRKQILEVHMRKVPVGDNVKLEVIARGTPGFSGADLANLVNEAALFAARTNKSNVGMKDFELAKDKILMGTERRSMVMSDAEKRNTAYHEAGHAIVGRLLPEHDPVYKVSIIPRGRALGVTMFLPEEDRYSQSKTAVLSKICAMFGGRAAEELILGADHVTTGAANDIKYATELTRNMVTKWGLSDKLGPQAYDDSDEEVFLGRSAATHQTRLATATAQRIDEEVTQIIDSSYARALDVLRENKDKLDAMAEALMKYETLDITQIDAVMAGETVQPPKEEPSTEGGSAAPQDDHKSRDSATLPLDEVGPAGLN